MSVGMSVIIGIFGLVAAVWVLKNFNKFAHRMQDFYVRESTKAKSQFNQPEQFKGSFFLFVCRAGFLFAGTLLFLFSLGLVFGGGAEL